MASHRLVLIKRLALGLTLAQTLTLGAGGPARAQFFQPFGYNYDMPPVDEERPRFATPRAVSRILGRRGFELVSGLGRFGDQVVVTGVSRREGAVRFFIDPYEGEVIRAVRLGPPPTEAAPPSYDEPPFPGPRGGPRAPLDDDYARRSARQGLEPPPPAGYRPPRPGQPSAKAPPPPAAGPVVAPVPAAPPAAPQAAKPQEAAKPIEWAKPAEIARPAEPPPAAPKTDPVKTEAPKVESSKVEASKTDASKTEPAKPQTAPAAAKPVVPTPAPEKPPADAKENGSKPARPAAERPGVPGRRAIVSPAPTGDAAAAAPR